MEPWPKAVIKMTPIINLKTPRTFVQTRQARRTACLIASLDEMGLSSNKTIPILCLFICLNPELFYSGQRSDT